MPTLEEPMDQRALAGRRSALALAAMIPERLQIVDEMVEIFGTNLLLGKGRHSAQAIAHLKLNQKSGERLIVDRRSEAGFATRMTLMALAHKNLMSACYPRLGYVEWSDNRFSTAR